MSRSFLHQFTFAVYLPVYREEEPQGTVAERRRDLEGFVVGAFRTDELFANVFEGPFDPAIDFEVYDGRHAGLSPPLYDNDGVKRATQKVADFPRQKAADSLFSQESRIEVAGRQWSLYFATLAGFEEEVHSRLPTSVLAGGVALSFLLFGITWGLVRIAVENSSYAPGAPRSRDPPRPCGCSTKPIDGQLVNAGSRALVSGYTAQLGSNGLVRLYDSRGSASPECRAATGRLRKLQFQLKENSHSVFQCI